MGKIVKKLNLKSDLAEIQREVLFDSKVSLSLIKLEIAKKIATILKLPAKRKFILADGKTKTETNLCCIVDIQINGKSLDGEFYVLKTLTRDVIVGVDFMQKWEISLDLKKEKIIVGVDPEKIEIV